MLQKWKISRCTGTARHIASLNKPRSIHKFNCFRDEDNLIAMAKVGRVEIVITSNDRLALNMWSFKIRGHG
jgi:hypothetical protein